jgi:hypothetical protein
MTKDRVVIVGDVISGFRMHGPFANNTEAFEYMQRHKDSFISDGWVDHSRTIKLVNFDAMTAVEIAKYEHVVGGYWAHLEDA